MVGVLRVLPALAAGYWIRPNYAKMDPNATYHGEQGVFIPHLTTTELITAPSTTTALATAMVKQQRSVDLAETTTKTKATTATTTQLATTSTQLATTTEPTRKTRLETTHTQLETTTQAPKTLKAAATTTALETTTQTLLQTTTQTRKPIATTTTQLITEQVAAGKTKPAKQVQAATQTQLETRLATAEASTGKARGFGLQKTTTLGSTTTQLHTTETTVQPPRRGAFNFAGRDSTTAGTTGTALVTEAAAVRGVRDETTTGLATTTRLATKKQEAEKAAYGARGGFFQRLMGGSSSSMSQMGIYFSNIPRHAEDLPSMHGKGTNDLYVYQDEPLTIGVWSEDDERYIAIEQGSGRDVDVVAPASGAALALGLPVPVKRESFVTLVPRGSVNSTKQLNVTVSDYEGNRQHQIPLHLHVVPSTSADLASLSVVGGRLDPAFSAAYPGTYKIRVPENASSFDLKFATLNDKDARCTLDGSKFFNAKGSARVRVPAPGSEPIVLTCYSADGQRSRQYHFDVIPQFGGETALSNIEVYGADLAEPFEPNNHGPYRADLIKGAQKDGGAELGWAKLKLSRLNPNAIIKVNGVPVTADEDAAGRHGPFSTSSQWIKVPRGEKKDLDISVTTPENPIPEVYKVSLSRETTRNPLSTDRGLKSTNWLGLLSTIASSRNAQSLLNNNKVLDVMSTYGHSVANNEGYAGFAEGFHTWNAQPGSCGSTWLKLKDANGYDIDCDVIPAGEISAAYPDQDAVFMGDEPEEVDVEGEVDTNGKWSFSNVLGKKGRKLISISPVERAIFKDELDAVSRDRANIYYYTSTLTITAELVAGLLICYGLVYALWLRDPETNQLRPDYPAILHPARFATFVLDFAFVGFVCGAFGILFTNKKLTGVSKVCLFNHVNVPVSMLNALAVLTLMLSVAYVVAGSAALSKVADRVGYSAQFCEYHDLVMTHGRAIHVPEWCRDIPVLRRLFAWNVDAIVPLKSATIPGSECVAFNEVQEAVTNGGADGPEAVGADTYNYQKLYGSASNAEGQYGDTKYTGAGPEDGPEYSAKRNGVQVAVNDYIYNDQATNYDGRNHQLYGKYPEAKFGETNFKLQNPYGYPVNINADLQIQHLTALMQLIDDLKFWAPKKNCYFPNSEPVKNLLAAANRGLYMDWTINRTLLFVALGLFCYFNGSASLVPLYILMVFAFVSAVIRFPPALFSGNAKYQRYCQTQAAEQQQIQSAADKIRSSNKIWPFNEPGFMERFRTIQARKRQSSVIGRLHSLVAPANPLEDALANDPNAYGMDETPANNDSFWNSQAMFQVREVVLSPCGADIAMFLLGAVLLVSTTRTRHAQSAGHVGLLSALLAVEICLVALICVNFRSLHTLYNVAQDTLDALFQKTTEFCIGVCDNVYGPGGLGERIPYYLAQCGKLLKGDKTANFHYPKGPVTVRKFPVSEVNVVSNELGLQFPGRVSESDLEYSCTVPDRKRLRLYKTLVVHGGLAGQRKELCRSLPVQVPFCKLFHENGAPALNPNSDFGRLVATIQVVNHTLRANVVGLPALNNNEHDSFLSLYASEEYLPTPGKVLLRKDGHTYSVRYDATRRRLTVRGPSVVANKQYSLKTSSSPAYSSRGDAYVNGRSPDDAVSSASAAVATPTTARAASQAVLCETPGALKLSVGVEQAPWLHKTLLVKPSGRLGHSATPFEIDPEEVKVYYDKDCGEMYLRHENLMVDEEYTVEWFLYPATPEPLDVTTYAQENGCVIFDLTCAGPNQDKTIDMPDLKSWMSLRDDSGAVIDIDPSMTDAYQFFFPEKNADGSSLGWFLQNLTGHVASLMNMIRGGDNENEASMMEEPIPCTIVQCVNPVQKVYRVDPNFGEGVRILNARAQELLARQKACELSENMCSLWPTLMSPTDYVQFWAKNGVDIVDDCGNLIDPLNEPSQVPAFHSQLKEIADGESQLRRVLSNLLDEKLRQLNTQIDAVRIWQRAYEDPVLHTAQLQADLSEWSNNGANSMSTGSSPQMVLESQKALYSSRLDGFFYPCNIPDGLISKRPNLSAQFRVWSNILQSWLFVEEGVELSNVEARLRISSVVRDVMQSLKFTLHGNELVSRNVYKSVLHYVVGSHTLRGVDANWKPDGLKAHTALVRIWTEAEDGTAGGADFTKYPEWLPCLLRLTPGAVQILLPNGDDLVRPASGNVAFPWQKSTGLYVPLHAFHKFEIVKDDENAPQEDGNVLLNFMTTRLVCRKNQRDGVPDNYARRVEDDQLGNEICFTDASGQRRMKYRMMIGHCVPRDEAIQYPQNEVDPTLSSSEVNVYPLSFRMAPAFAEQWQRAIDMAGLHMPHDHIFDASMDVSSSDRNAEEPSIDQSTIIDPPSEPSEQYVPPSIPSEPSVSDEPSLPTPVVPDCVRETQSEQSRSVESNLDGVSLYEGPIVSSSASTEPGSLTGPAILRDEGGRAVCQADFMEAKRVGKGRVCFTDSQGAQWTYEGGFHNDETAGECVVSLADSTAVANATDRYTLVSFTGTVAPPSHHSERQILHPEEVNALLHNTPTKRAEVFTRTASSLPNKQKVLDLIQSVYARNEAYGYRLTADRFNVADVLQDKYLLEQAREGKCPLSRFLQTFLPYACSWQDESTLNRAEGTTGEWRFVDGSVWQGSLGGGKPAGKGVYSHWPTRTLFEGVMRNGLPDGEGIMVTGEEGRRAMYIGALVQGAREGQGTLNTHGKQAKLQANWNQDKLGTGPLTIEVSEPLMKQLDIPFSKFEGYVKDGVPEGDAFITYGDGRTFKGQVKNGVRQGRGELKDSNGDVIVEGNFSDGSPDGLTKYIKYPDGMVYKGDLVKGVRQGMGHLVDPKTSVVVYEGTWANDVPHGRGVYRAPDGEYDGEFRNGKRHGKGRFTYKEKPLANGKQRVYEGDWSNDMPHGVGKYTNDDGVERVYRLEKGDIVSSSVNSYAPTCGKAPQVGTKPTVQASNFKPFNEKDLPWKKSKHASISNVLQVLTDSAPSWAETAGKSTTFIDPNRIVPLERIDL